MSKLQLKDCIEPLLNFTLALSIEEAIDTGLSKEFCSNLLKEDDHEHTYSSSTSPTDHFEGVLPYPLYKHLASALFKSISSGSIHKMHTDAPFIHEDSSLKLKECKWNKSIQEKGSDLIKMLETVEFELHVQDPFFSQLKDGHKTIEGRCAGGKNRVLIVSIQPGSLILFNKCLLLQVQDVHWYASFSDMLAAEGVAKVLPGVETIQEGIQIYRKFYSEEREKSNGVLAILVKPTSQLYDHLASILVVKSSVLSDGARALAKHVNRSKGKFWGSFSGNESHKNMLALKLINHLIAHCCWLNVHIVPPHGPVFEIRVQDGYGARWSLNPTKFIGFLEPYMEDGHARGWKH
ncbi:hypothetical protein L1987_73356 [Smallanthus sonchifolius]|uniref:Uncharacterized protein n=1 Tax=Smallanthus sonchifolius TaxID=185202 RepID=A0ACB8ZZQ2_9ASTR|nr:hypothetical protein L1987_73356 [Smallanthus sonchifolius]